MRSAECAGRIAFALVFGVMFAFAPTAHGGTIPESERWATITHPGNPAHPPPEPGGFPTGYGRPVGQVNYEYQISRTETTGSEWFEFVLAYAPFINPAEAGSSSFYSNRVRAVQTAPGVWQYTLRSNAANRSVEVGWRYAARFCNWLHNGKANTAEAFERGVYDSSTFGGNPQAGFTDQRERSPGATYFLPTLDEWIKASFWDPARYNPITGETGYWLYPNGTDMPLVPGAPDMGGQTTVGTFGPGGPTVGMYEVGEYVNVQSPWGLWDVSGGRSEWLETAIIDTITGAMLSRGRGGSRDWEIDLTGTADHIDRPRSGPPDFTDQGIRLARIVPSPGTAVALGCVFLRTTHTRRRR
ncbi:MAG: SUMF1/EgtB/PvdO family nonheme iron enzyme [Phycisphaerae bacterium]|nr:SUMF1/EgtB/PvdO family nonheme iron enzyme [Phycisphaerae bacterium]